MASVTYDDSLRVADIVTATQLNCATVTTTNADRRFSGTSKQSLCFYRRLNPLLKPDVANDRLTSGQYFSLKTLYITARLKPLVSSCSSINRLQACKLFSHSQRPMTSAMNFS